MAFPKKKSRSLTLDGRVYQWIISPLDEDFVMRIRISAGASELSHIVETYALTGMAVTPRFIAGLIRHGLAAGWQPESKGPEFKLELPPETESYIKNKGATRLNSGTQAFDIPQQGYVLCARSDTDPIRVQLPWEHHLNVFADVRIWGGVSDKAIGSFMAGLLEDDEDASEPEVSKRLQELADRELDEWHLSGGIQLWSDGKLLMTHGCCVDLSDWLEWVSVCDEGWSPWNGHDPFSSARYEDGWVCFHEGTDELKARMSLADYQTCLLQLQQDLSDFTEAVAQWLKQKTEPALAQEITRKLVEALQLT